MVFVNDKKFSCESCIKGHRASTCSHSDRALFEVPRKGRPLSQCPNCRELRKTKRYHSKCVCPKEIPSRGILLPSSCLKTRRYIPIQPALPNGLRDTVHPSYSYSPSDSRQQVGSLLNPCNCKIGRMCKCYTLGRKARSPKTSTTGTTTTSATTGSSHSPSPPGPTLAPILKFSSPTHSPSSTPSIPAFGTQLPPMRVMESLAGSGCTCGVECICPGCVEHRGPTHAAASGRRSCTDGCGMCIDVRSDIVLTQPPGTSASSIDRFLARAAALPAPPSNPREVVNLPKLCCGGRCGCPEGTCGCGKSCDGCGQDHGRDGARLQEESGFEQSVSSTPPRKRACCGG
ncbi:copper fist DNA binding domain-containing protein [Mycena epipterygia]|nr:copper fist DNA binding domain-containing protein [Mycena epipterygia]